MREDSDRGRESVTGVLHLRERSRFGNGLSAVVRCSDLFRHLQRGDRSGRNGRRQEVTPLAPVRDATPVGTKALS